MITCTAYSDYVLPALTIWREARGESNEAMLAVAWVIRNRVGDTRWPDTSLSVCLQAKQFSAHNPNDPNATKLPQPRYPIDFAAFERACTAWESHAPDPTSGANHYETLPDNKEPRWADEEKITLRLGKFEFYKL